ncbi:hypothetical protein TNCT_429471 [Trichonephila clavata]|uniref:Uncharacterized protein n=1 Tax=Trichonephila clavata TaxID=2740835 RepID=A0A8X6LEZ4_TRICU|nr:hypothetical protein TNCT_429471 [Trichonephila clavata]
MHDGPKQLSVISLNPEDTETDENFDNPSIIQMIRATRPISAIRCEYDLDDRTFSSSFCYGHFGCHPSEHCAPSMVSSNSISAVLWTTRSRVVHL